MPGLDIATTRTPPLPSQKRRQAELNASLNASAHATTDSRKTSLSSIHRDYDDDHFVSPLSNTQPLPVTPPSPGDDKSNADHRDGRQFRESSLPNPITPDITPPKRPSFASITDPSSSRADSFRTAVENLSSDADADDPWYSALSLVNPQTVLNQSSQKSFSSDKSVPSKSNHSSSSTLTTTPIADVTADRGLPERDYSSSSSSLNDQRDPDGILVSIQNKSRRASSLLPPAREEPQSVHLSRNPRSPQKPLRDRVKDANWDRDIESPTIERFREEINWPADNVPPSSEDQQQPIDHPPSRLSSGSPTSTVTAVIIDPPQQHRPRHLRHAPKQSSLRSVSAPIPRVSRAARTSSSKPDLREINQSQRTDESYNTSRQLHKPRAPAHSHDRRSISSDVVSTSSGLSSHEVIPVVVIPDRYSSREFSKAPSSRKGTSTASSRASSHHRRAEHNEAGPLNPPRRRKRRLSDNTTTSHSQSGTRGKSASGPPVIPPRTTSLSAPTTGNNSRATSLTSESLWQHTMAIDSEHGLLNGTNNKPEDDTPALRVSDESGQNRDINAAAGAPVNISTAPEPAKLTPSPIPSGQRASAEPELDAHLRPQSIPLTHLSFPSMSSPRTVEIDEATTVNLFPHKNTSLLVVDHPQFGPYANGDIAVPTEAEADANNDEASKNTIEPEPEPEAEYLSEVDSQVGREVPSEIDREGEEEEEREQEENTEWQLYTPMDYAEDWPLPNPSPNPRNHPNPPVYEEEVNNNDISQHEASPGDERGLDFIDNNMTRQHAGSASTQRRQSFNSAMQSLSLKSVKNWKRGSGNKGIDKRLQPFWEPRAFWDQSVMDANISSPVPSQQPQPSAVTTADATLPPEYSDNNNDNHNNGTRAVMYNDHSGSGHSITDNHDHEGYNNNNYNYNNNIPRMLSPNQYLLERPIISSPISTTSARYFTTATATARRSPEMRKLLDRMSAQSSPVIGIRRLRPTNIHGGTGTGMRTAILQLKNPRRIKSVPRQVIMRTRNIHGRTLGFRRSIRNRVKQRAEFKREQKRIKMREFNIVHDDGDGDRVIGNGNGNGHEEMLPAYELLHGYDEYGY